MSAQRDEAPGCPPGVYVHPLGLCESDRVGAGTRIWAFAHVMEGSVVGRDCNVCDHAFVETGAVVGDRVTLKNGVAVWDRVTIADDVFVGPFAVFTNDLNPRAAFKKDATQFLPTTVGPGATIGANATIVCGHVVGENAFVGAGATVVDDVAPYALVVGTPAVRVGWACACGQRLPEDLLVCACGRAYEAQAGERGGLRLIDGGR
jgi:UDP-2-acetamido-3-amino-2,3-dideoxy-glucuronate N-acetyltransferase